MEIETGAENTNTTGEEQVSQVTSQAEGQTPEQGVQTGESEYNPDWYKSDGRVGKMWKSPDVRDDIVKSYYNLEKQYKPLAEQHKSYNTTFKELGIADMDALKVLHTEHQELKSPENRTNQLAGYFGNWLDNPMYSQDIQRFFNDLEVRELQRLYPNMTAEQIQKQQELETKVNAFEAERAKQEFETNKNKYLETFKTGSEKNKKLAESLGFNYSPEVDRACLDYVMKHDEQNGYPCTMAEAFNELYGAKLEEARMHKLEADLLKRQNKQTVVSAVKTGKTPNVKPEGLDAKNNAFNETLKGIFGNKT